MRRAVRGLSTVLVVVGVLLLADVAATLVWQEPISGVYARVQQKRLADRLAAIERVPVTPVERKVLDRLPAGAPRLGFAARSLDRRVEEGGPVGRIKVGKIGLDEVVVQGTGTGDLRRGPGHGDRIEMLMPYGRFTYTVERTRIVPPTATWVTNRAAHDRLVLTACHPLYSAAQRIVVFARLSTARARGATA